MIQLVINSLVDARHMNLLDVKYERMYINVILE